MKEYVKELARMTLRLRTETTSLQGDLFNGMPRRGLKVANDFYALVETWERAEERIGIVDGAEHICDLLGGFCRDVLQAYMPEAYNNLVFCTTSTLRHQAALIAGGIHALASGHSSPMLNGNIKTLCAGITTACDALMVKLEEARDGQKPKAPPPPSAAHLPETKGLLTKRPEPLPIKKTGSFPRLAVDNVKKA